MESADLKEYLIELLIIVTGVLIAEIIYGVVFK